MATSPPLSGHSKKPHFQVQKPASMVHQIPTKSHSNPLCKTLIIVLLLLAIPLFPSQAPDFISQSIVITQFWEIIHLLFIGIAVSYGLFSRKTSEKTVISANDEGSHAYLSGISHLSSVFEDGFENLSGPDEQFTIAHSYTNSNSDALFLGKDRNIRSCVSKDGVENVCEGNVKKVNQTWRSEYSKGESLIVVSNGKYFLDGVNDFKPLNLPVRSLRTNIMEPESRNRAEFSPKFDAKSENDAKVSLTPPIPWRSRSGRMETGEKQGKAKPFMHYRPHSVGEFEFEEFKSSSRELSNLEVETNDKNSVFPVSNSRSFSTGSSSEMRNFEHNVKSFGYNGNEDKIEKGKQAIEFESSLGVAKALSRGKSVRTIKHGRYKGSFGRAFKRGRGEEEEPEKPPIDYPNESIFPMPKPKPTLVEFHNDENEEIDDENEAKSEVNKGCDEENNYNRNGIENDDELEGSEVDRKAGEFIAKFREQIRLQKMSSVRSQTG